MHNPGPRQWPSGGVLVGWRARAWAGMSIQCVCGGPSLSGQRWVWQRRTLHCPPQMPGTDLEVTCEVVFLLLFFFNVDHF